MFINKILYQFSMTAAKRKIDNSFTEEVFENIKELDKFIETAYKSWKQYSYDNSLPESKFVIVSGYRCEELNKVLGGTSDSPHLKGYAADVYIKNPSVWNHYCRWASLFAKDCFEKGILFHQIIPEGNGKFNWIHIALKGFDGQQIMRSIELPVVGQPFKAVTYGTPLTYGSENLSKETEHLQNVLEDLPISSSEIEGEHGENRMDLNDMPGSYSRCIYIMKRLMNNFGFTDFQSAGILGNLLCDTQGRLSTTKSKNGNAGICMWNPEDQIRFRNMFMNDDTLSDSNLIAQTSFLINDLSKYRLVKRLKKTRNLNESCMKFYTLYEKFGEKINLMDTDIRKDTSKRRGYSTSALEIYRNYIDKYKDESLTGYYQGNGVNDGPAIEIGDDTRLWKSRDINLSSEDLEEYVIKQLVEIEDTERLFSGYEI